MGSINLRRVLALILGMVVLLMLITLIISFILLNMTNIYEGITINGVDVSGLNRIEAIEKLRLAFNDELDKTVIMLTYEDYTYETRYKDIGVKYDYYKAVSDAHSVGRSNYTLKNLKDIVKLKFKGKDIPLGLIYDETKLHSVIEDIRNDIDVKSQNATISYVNGVFDITKETVGKKVNAELLKNRMITGIYDFSNVIIPVEKDFPKITAKELNKIKYAIGKYTSNFGGSSVARKNNINVAAKKIDGYLLLPGEIFSFNKATGARNQETGYMISKVIVNGEFVDDVGGGVCQVSTTLYNAALRAGLEIVERHHHSLPVGYVPKGEDATVSYGYLDLKFRNNYNFPIYIKADVTTYYVTFRVFGGEMKKNRYIDIVSIIEERVKPDIEKRVDYSLNPWASEIVQQGRYGYKVKTFRVFYEDGKEVKRELISEDFYKPKKYIIKVGPNASKESSIQDTNNRGRLLQ